MECHCERCAPLEWERAGLLGMDALPNDDGLMIAADAGRVRSITQESAPVPKLSGRNRWLRRLEHMLDEEPEEFDEDVEPDEDEKEVAERELSGRDLYLARLRARQR